MKAKPKTTSADPEPDKLLTVDEVAEFLRTTRRAVQRYCKDGLFLGAFKLSDNTSDWRIPQSGLDAYLKKQRDQATNA